MVLCSTRAVSFTYLITICTPVILPPPTADQRNKGDLLHDTTGSVLLFQAYVYHG
uniref:Uncharacterized protein n=1 Tax=Picea sitchensis TaxID=3332 RepID=A0A6B9XUY2_PICSI|nr:hypothetical protein Q903MT_gene3828 [Picea sitchensis]